MSQRAKRARRTLLGLIGASSCVACAQVLDVASDSIPGPGECTAEEAFASAQQLLSILRPGVQFRYAQAHLSRVVGAPANWVFELGMPECFVSIVASSGRVRSFDETCWADVPRRDPSQFALRTPQECHDVATQMWLTLTCTSSNERAATKFSEETEHHRGSYMLSVPTVVDGWVTGLGGHLVLDRLDGRVVEYSAPPDFVVETREAVVPEHAAARLATEHYQTHCPALLRDASAEPSMPELRYVRPSSRHGGIRYEEDETPARLRLGWQLRIGASTVVIDAVTGQALHERFAKHQSG